MGLFESIFNLGGKVKQAKEQRATAKEEAERNLRTIQSLDWEPMYSSQTIPQYQKSQSPVARSFLESFLAGNNPAATFSGSPNAAVNKAVQQKQQNAMFGTMGERLYKQRQIDSYNPYQVKTPTRPVVTEKGKSAQTVQQYPIMADNGVTDPRLAQALISSKMFNEKSGKWSSVVNGARVQQMLKAYGGDQAAVADLLERNGSFGKAAAEYRKTKKGKK